MFVAFVDCVEIPGVEPREIEAVISGPDDIDDFVRDYDHEAEVRNMRLHYGAEDRAAFETELACSQPLGAWVHISYPDQRDEKSTKDEKYLSRPDAVVFFAFSAKKKTVPGIRHAHIFMRVADQFEIDRLKRHPPSDWRIEGYRLYYPPRQLIG